MIREESKPARNYFFGQRFKVILVRNFFPPLFYTRVKVIQCCLYCTLRTDGRTYILFEEMVQLTSIHPPIFWAEHPFTFTREVCLRGWNIAVFCREMSEWLSDSSLQTPKKVKRNIFQSHEFAQQLELNSTEWGLLNHHIHMCLKQGQNMHRTHVLWRHKLRLVSHYISQFNGVIKYICTKKLPLKKYNT